MRDIFIISKLIIKKKLKILTDDEKSLLQNFKKEYPFAGQTNFDFIVGKISNYSLIDKEKAWQKIASKSNKRNVFSLNKKKGSWLRYAAAALIVVSLSVYFFRKDAFVNPADTHETVVIDIPVIKPGTNKAVLVLAGGEQVVLGKGKSYKNASAASSGEEITYKNSLSKKGDKLFNYLIVPRGGNFTISLSDGTKVWLNSESKLKFPVAFTKGESRDVELLYGEAYFEVSPSIKHQGTHFFVHNNKQQVEVVGTQFNIKAYPDENNVFTTLVEGKVTVSTDQQTEKLVPGQQSQLNLKYKSFKISQVDVSRSIAWKEGVFYFEDESIENILRTMSRWYDFEYKFKSETLKNSRFTGLIKKRKNLEDILNVISRTSNIKYSINSKNDVNEVIISSK